VLVWWRQRRENRPVHASTMPLNDLLATPAVVPHWLVGGAGCSEPEPVTPSTG
jgi:hypothetical protein